MPRSTRRLESWSASDLNRRSGREYREYRRWRMFMENVRLVMHQDRASTTDAPRCSRDPCFSRRSAMLRARSLSGLRQPKFRRADPVNDNSARKAVLPYAHAQDEQVARGCDVGKITNEILIPIGLPITECESAYTMCSDERRSHRDDKQFPSSIRRRRQKSYIFKPHRKNPFIEPLSRPCLTLHRKTSSRWLLNLLSSW